MGVDPVTATIGAAIVGAVVNTVSGQQQASAQKKAASQQQQAADRLYQQQQEQNNKQNARDPNIDALFAQNEIEGQQGQSGTMLTGPMGVDPNSLSLGKNTLLGGA